MLRAIRNRTGLSVAVQVTLYAAGLLLGGPVQAQQATPIKVEAKVDSPSLIRAWGATETQVIAAELTEHVTRSLSDRFRHWDFAPDFERFYATLELRIHESVPNKIDIVLDRLASSGQRHTIWQQVWLKPTDFALGRRPPRTVAADHLKNKFTEAFDETRQQLVENWLHEVPLGARGRWIGRQQLSTLRIVTSLPWRRFAGLERSRLMLSCKRQGQEIEVRSRATGESNQFSDPQLTTAYDALVLIPETISDRPVGEADLQDLVQYKVLLIFLLEELEPVDDEFFALSG